jgi:hypothetical protein
MSPVEPGKEPEQRRATHRVHFAEEVRILAPVPMMGRGVDIGAGGIGLIVPKEIPAGRMVEIVILEGVATAYGTVRWSRRDGESWRVGIQFREEDWAIMELIDALHSQEG